MPCRGSLLHVPRFLGSAEKGHHWWHKWYHRQSHPPKIIKHPQKPWSPICGIFDNFCMKPWFLGISLPMISYAITWYIVCGTAGIAQPQLEAATFLDVPVAASAKRWQHRDEWFGPWDQAEEYHRNCEDLWRYDSSDCVIYIYTYLFNLVIYFSHCKSHCYLFFGLSLHHFQSWDSASDQHHSVSILAGCCLGNAAGEDMPWQVVEWMMSHQTNGRWMSNDM